MCDRLPSLSSLYLSFSHHHRRATKKMSIEDGRRRDAAEQRVCSRDTGSRQYSVDVRARHELRLRNPLSAAARVDGVGALDGPRRGSARVHGRLAKVPLQLLRLRSALGHLPGRQHGARPEREGAAHGPGGPGRDPADEPGRHVQRLCAAEPARLPAALRRAEAQAGACQAQVEGLGAVGRV